MNIQPFRAITPNANWFSDLLSSGKYPMIKSFLEPSADEFTIGRLYKNRDTLENLLVTGKYCMAEQPALYIYEKQDAEGSQFGVWALTSLDNLTDDRILAHEQTLTAHSERLRLYRQLVGLEGSPVVLTYSRDRVITKLIENITRHAACQCFEQGEIKHRLWTISDQQQQAALVTAFSKIPKTCIADGHHRVAAAGAIHAGKRQWISTLYVSTGQLSAKAFHRMAIPDVAVDESSFFTALGCYFQIDEVAENMPLRPGKSGHLGLYFNQKWYALELRKVHAEQPDVSLLQEHILDGYFGITDPRADPRLSCWPDDKWMAMLEASSSRAETILFTLFPVSPQKLMQIALTGQHLPPKSTSIEPKVPYGLLLYRTATETQSLQLK